MSGAEVRLGRWQDVIPGTYDPARAIVVTDPPFGLDEASGHKGYGDAIPWARHVEEVLELLPAVRHLIRGPAPWLVARDHPQPRRMCIEVGSFRRGSYKPGAVPYMWNGWAVYGRLALERHVRRPAGDVIVMRMPARSRHDAEGALTRRTDHRALTPYESAQWIVDTWADAGSIVVDPFAGMGTIGVAAKVLGFDYLGAELVPEYADCAAEALLSDRPRIAW